MLTEILKTLRAGGPMSLADLARHFHSDVSAMAGMLQTLEKKGRIARMETKCSRCKGCAEMKPEDALVYKELLRPLDSPDPVTGEVNPCTEADCLRRVQRSGPVP